MHDAFEASNAPNLYAPLPAGVGVPGTNVGARIAGAACATLSFLYPSQRPQFEAAVAGANMAPLDAGISAQFGRAIAQNLIDKLARPADFYASDKGYVGTPGPGRHRTDPTDPNQGYHGPRYGVQARRFAVTKQHTLAAPPSQGSAGYLSVLQEVRAKGAKPGTIGLTRTPNETLVGLYWAYDGPKNIGTPPRLYNQIARQLADQFALTEGQCARLFALVNAAMGDAGIYAWREKYRHDVWRPVLGIREHAASMGPLANPGNVLNANCDPFWLPLGAPKTNSDAPPFTPPFPAYPSGHATFGAASMQMMRLYLKEIGKMDLADTHTSDTIQFSLVSDELNGVSTDTGVVRPRHERQFESLWQAIFENGVSRVFLGVHWSFDAFATADTKVNGAYKPANTITYNLIQGQQIGGVPLGLSIADDIYNSGLKIANVLLVG